MNANDMMVDHFTFDGDEDAILFFNSIAYFLIVHLECSKQDAIDVINEYYISHEKYDPARQYGETWRGILEHDDYYIASCRIYQWKYGPKDKELNEWIYELEKQKSPYDTFKSYNEMMEVVIAKLRS